MLANSEDPDQTERGVWSRSALLAYVFLIVWAARHKWV